MKNSLIGRLAIVGSLAGIVVLAGCKDDKKPEGTTTPSATPSVVASAAPTPSTTASAAPSAVAEDDTATEEDFEEEDEAQVSEANLDQELRKLEDEIK